MNNIMTNFWPLIFIILSSLTFYRFIVHFFQIKERTIKNQCYAEFKNDVSLCIGICIVVTVIIWRYDLWFTTLQTESLDNLNIIEGIGYRILSKGASNLGVKTSEGTCYEIPVFDFSLFGGDVSSEETIKIASGQSVKIWYKEKFHRYVYQFSLNEDFAKL